MFLRFAFSIKFLVIAFLIVPFFLCAKIVEVDRIEKILPYIQENMLIVFDLDNTLIHTVQDLGSDQWFSHRMQELQEKEEDVETAREKVILEYYTILNMTDVKPVEKMTSKVFEALQKKRNLIILFHL